MKRTSFSWLLLAVAGCIFFLPCMIYAAEIVLKKNPEKSMEVEVVQLTDSAITVKFHEVDLTYLLDEVKTLNGIAEMSRSKLDELQALGAAYVGQEKYQEAVDLLSKIIDLDPSNLGVVGNLVVAYTKLKKYEEAIPYILEKIKQEPDDPKNYARLGNAYSHYKSKEKEAVAAYAKVVELENGPTVRNQKDMGYVYCYYQKWAESLAYLEKVMTMVTPGSEELDRHFYEALGFCYQFLGRHQEAIAAFQNAMQKAPPSQHGQAYHGLSLVYRSLGQSEKAAECERKAKEIGGWRSWW